MILSLLLVYTTIYNTIDYMILFHYYCGGARVPAALEGAASQISGVNVHVYIYIYIERERERDIERETGIIHYPKYDDNVSFQGLLQFAPT